MVRISEGSLGQPLGFALKWTMYFAITRLLCARVEPRPGEFLTPLSLLYSSVKRSADRVGMTRVAEHRDAATALKRPAGGSRSEASAPVSRRSALPHFVSMKKGPLSSDGR